MRRGQTTIEFAIVMAGLVGIAVWLAVNLLGKQSNGPISDAQLIATKNISNDKN